MSNTNKADVIRKKWHPAGWMPAGFREMWEYAVDLERLLNAAECRIQDLEQAAPQAQEETRSSNKKENMTQEELFLKEVLAEIHRARGLFPTPDGLICAAGEEFGEVCKAYLDESKTRVREECVQLAAMAARITLEGDPTLEGYRAKRGADKET